MPALNALSTISTITSGWTTETRPSNRTDAMLDMVVDLCHPTRILVVGCGDGREAGLLARTFDAQAIGIDVGRHAAFDALAAAPAMLVEMDPRDLQFPEGHFDLVCSFDTFSRVAGPRLAVREMARVLRPGGHFVLGERSAGRLLGDAARRELQQLCRQAFGEARPLSDDYYRRRHRASMLSTLERLGLTRVVLPLVCVGGQRR